MNSGKPLPGSHLRTRRLGVALVVVLGLMVMALVAGAYLRRTPELTAAQAAQAAETAQAFEPVVVTPAPDASALVAGFSDEHVADIPMPSAMAWTPDGRVLVTSTPGWLYVIQNDALVPTPALNITAERLLQRRAGHGRRDGRS